MVPMPMTMSGGHAPYRPPLADPTEREYLVCCRGRPTQGAWIRMDAMARIARAGLCKGCTTHLLFEDCLLITLMPQFIGEGAWGAPLKATSEGKLLELFQRLVAGEDIFGARCVAPRKRGRAGARRDALLEVLSDTSLGMVMFLCEEGVSLFYESAAEQCLADPPGDPDLKGIRTLVVLGGVRDVLPEETRTLYELCGELQVPIYPVSLGVSSELTSKCIKTFEVLAGDLNLWRRALAVAGGGGITPRHPELEQVVEACSSAAAPLHVVIALNEELSKFLVRPAAAMLVADVFMGSHQHYIKSRTLSLIGRDGPAVSLRIRGGRVPLTEEEALAYCVEEGARMREQGIRDILLADQERLGCGNLSQLMLLHADSGAPLLRWPLRRSPDQRPVAVAFAPQRLKAQIREVAGEVGAYASATVSNLLAGPAFVSMLHNDGLLSAAIRNPQWFVPS